MLTFLLGLLLASLLFIAISLQKTYHHVPVRELKRQANQGDDISRLFYRVVAYGLSLDMFLWMIIGLSAGGFFVFLSVNLPWPVALFGCVACIWFGFAWMPGSHITRPGVLIARLMARPLAAILEWLHTPLVRLFNFISRFRPVTVHTGLYSKDDILEFIAQQKAQIDNRVSKHDLNIVANMLVLSDRKVGDIMTPWRKVKLVTTHDMVGPVLMDELHSSGHSHFPVYEGGDKKNLVGVLGIADMLDTKAGGFVKDVMVKRILYLHEDDKISEAFNTIAETKHPLFIVVNDKEDIIGVLSITEVVRQMLGDMPNSDFERHHDKSAVSKKKKSKEAKIDETIVIDDKTIEPVEKVESEKEENTETEDEK